jgi:hypothetical protein
MAVSEGRVRWKCSQCSQSCSQCVPSLGAVDSSSSQCSGFRAVIPISAVPFVIHILQEQGTLGTMGTRLKRHEFFLSRSVERTWNTGNSPTRFCAARSRAFVRTNSNPRRWRTSEFAAPAFATTEIRANWLAVGSEASLGRDAPVRRVVVRVVKCRLIGVHDRVDVHALGAELEAVHAHVNFRRFQ